MNIWKALRIISFVLMVIGCLLSFVISYEYWDVPLTVGERFATVKDVYWILIPAWVTYVIATIKEK